MVWRITSLYSSFVQYDVQGAMQRWMKYSRHGRGSLPVMVMVQLRQGKSFFVTSRVFRTEPADANGPK